MYLKQNGLEPSGHQDSRIAVAAITNGLALNLRLCRLFSLALNLRLCRIFIISLDLRLCGLFLISPRSPVCRFFLISSLCDFVGSFSLALNHKLLQIRIAPRPVSPFRSLTTGLHFPAPDKSPAALPLSPKCVSASNTWTSGSTDVRQWT